MVIEYGYSFGGKCVVFLCLLEGNQPNFSARVKLYSENVNATCVRYKCVQIAIPPNIFLTQNKWSRLKSNIRTLKIEYEFND